MNNYNRLTKVWYPYDDIEEMMTLTYDYYDVYNQEIQYVSDPFPGRFSRGGKQIRMYKWEIITGKDDKKFIGAKEIFNEDELKKLEKYCSCTVCQMWFFNPVKYMACPCCYGCIKSGPEFVHTTNVKKARLASKN